MSRKFAHLPAQLLRRALQLGVVAFILYATVGSIWRNYKVAHNNARLVGLMHGDSWADAYRFNEWLLKHWNERSYEASLDFLGMPWAATIFGHTTVDPILALSAMVSTRSFMPQLLLASLTALVVAVVLGKVFCSHLCPMRLAFELGQRVRAGLLRLGVPLLHLRSDTRLGGWVLLGGLLASLSVGLSVWFVLLPYLDLGASIYLGVTAGTTMGLLTLPLAWWALDLLVAPGMFCRNLCPQGFLLEQLGRRSLLQLRKNPAKGACPSNCRVCTMTCPYGLSPREQTHRPMCDNCGNCVPTCPTGALSRRFRLPIVTGLAVLLSLAPLSAQAHHNKGLPHYGYFENYPQVPTEEVIVIDGRWEMGATIFNFQGYDRKESGTPNDVKFFMYLYDLEANAPYMGPVEFDVVLDGEVISTFVRERPDTEVVYASRETLPETGNYQLVARIPSDSLAPALDFYIDLDEGAVSWWLVGGLLGGLGLIFGLALLGRSRKGRSLLMLDRPVPEY